jgi:hypothetical protein
VRLASSLHWRLLIGTILVLMAAAWLTPRWVRPPDIQENRILAPKPDWPRRFVDLKAFRLASDAYVADHFPARPQLIGVLNRARMLAGVSGSKRVIVGRDGWLFFDDDTHLGAARGDPPMLEPETRAWLETFAGRTEALRARGIPYLVVAAPVKETIYPRFGPAWFPGPSSNRATVRLAHLAAQAGAGEVIYLHDAVAGTTRAGRKTFSRHDTHWTGYGAYAGYFGLMTRLHALGLTAEGPRPLSDFKLLDFPPSHGPRDLALMLGVASFVDLDFPHLISKTADPVFRTSYLSDKTDWTGPQVVDTGVTGKPVLLMTRDSFSNELLPFLYPHFSRIILAHNQDGAWRPDLIDRFKPDIVILEVVEHGLRVSMGEGPPASESAVARIDQVMASMRLANAIAPPTFGVPTPRFAALLAAAKPADRCNFDIAVLKAGAATSGLSVGGWIWDHERNDRTPDGFIEIDGASARLIAKLRVDKPRPDVSSAFGDPRAKLTGFVATYGVKGLTSGPYRLTASRRSGEGWIACHAKQSLASP